jgi:hypothetical protein
MNKGVEKYLDKLFSVLTIENGITSDTSDKWSGFFLKENDEYRVVLGFRAKSNRNRLDWFYCGIYFEHMIDFFSITRNELIILLKEL